MYTISADKQIIYAPNVRSKEYCVLSPKLTMELNKAGSLEFTIPVSNNNYDVIQKLKSILIVEQDGEEMWRGRTMTSESDFYKNKHMYNEGELAYLLDSKIRPYCYSGSVSGYFKFLINQHNEQVDDFQRFSVGNVTVSDKDGNDYIVRDNKNYPDTFSEISDKLLNNLGGYLKIRREGDTRYLDYMAEPGDKSNQVIQFGVNLLDISEYINAEDVFTVLIPLGYQEQEERLTIKSVNGGKDYLEDSTGIKLFGRITKVQTWDDVTLPENLKTKGNQYLKTGIEMAVTLTIKAVDLADFGVDVSRIKIGDYVRVVSIPHDIDTYFLCSKIVYDLSNPGKTEYTLGVSFESLTDKQAENQKSSAITMKIANEAAQGATKASETALNAITIAKETGESTKNLVTNVEFEKYKKDADNTYAKRIDVPTKVSQLENDEKYINNAEFENLAKRVEALEGKETE